MGKKKIYKIVFHNDGKVFEVYARSVSQGGLFGFVEIEGLLFGQKSSLVVDPTEESLMHEFDGVNRTYVPLHAVVRIDEVGKQGPAKIHAVDSKNSKVTSLPTPLYTPPKPES